MSAADRQMNVLGVFARSDALHSAIKQARSAGFEIGDVYLPAAHHEIIDELHPRKSPVRFFTFTGATAGLLAGFALALLTSLIWNLVVSGKPVTSIVPFTVIGFEFTILLGALCTLLALLLFARLPFRKFPHRLYREQFSHDRFGLWICCSETQLSDVRALLESNGVQQIEELADDADSGGKGLER